MNTIEIARRLAECGERPRPSGPTPSRYRRLTCPGGGTGGCQLPSFLKGDYRIAYTSFLSLYRRGCFQAELLELMTQAFYLPNVDSLRRRGMRRTAPCWLAIPTCSGGIFRPLRSCPSASTPYDDNGYLPFDRKSGVFSDYVNFQHSSGGSKLLS